MRNLTLLLILLLSHSVFAQKDKAVKQVVDDFFVAMEAKDTLALDALMHPNCMLYSTKYDKEGKVKNEVLYKAALLGFMKRAIEKKYKYDEKLWSYDIQIDENIATVWTEYTMFIGDNLDKLSHCGTNIFNLMRNEQKEWVITSISDTRRKQDCIEEESPQTQQEVVNTLLDDWHKAAATADADAFFGKMTEDGIYIGTDASERWLRDDLREWSKFAFDREVAWAFEPQKREVYFSDNYKTAWFEESLDTWMGVCRGSGVLVKQAGEWKIKHYHLSVTIPNDLVNCFIHLVEKGKCKRKRKK